MDDHAPEGQGQPQEQRAPFAEGVAHHGTRPVPAREVAVGETGALEILDVALDARAQGGHADGLDGGEVMIGARGPLPPRRAILRLARGLRHLFAPDGLGRVDEIQDAAIMRLDDEPLESLSEPLGQPPHRHVGPSRRQRGQVRRRHGLSHQDQRRPSPEGARLAEHEPDGEQGRGGSRIARGAQEEPRRARAQRHQRGLGLAHALGKDQDRVSHGEGALRRAEHGLVVDRAAPLVLASVNRNGPG